MNSTHVFTATISWLILIVSVVGNVALIIALKHHFRRSSRLYICLMFNLAATDIVFVVSSIPFTFVEKLHAPQFPFGAALCKLLMPFQTTAAMTAIFTVVTLSCQRYFMIVRPTEEPQEGHNLTLFLTVFSLWFLPIVLAAIPLGIALKYQNERCLESWPDVFKRCFTVYLTVIQYIGPLAVITWCNGRAVVELKRHDRYRENCAIINDVILERHNNVVRMLICIVVVFAVFWFPGQLAWIAVTFSDGGEKWYRILEVSELFVFANSALNPLIFFVYNGEYSFGKLGYLLRFKQKSSHSTRYRVRTGSGTADILSAV
ncbi:neuropeptide Y receptor type 6-like isoform X2 [Dendronephthya gigantea]|nr:neuropeptide Y receptor type 6-like isoform X2 [Dendronephthya gigantea]XP_028392940.1 neuropeptide Y receptor type 6-like isoform X2 [Dendronephthya gigantea]XP_028392941.1 neuropeptide Y receptor type 6-like isoform X2 [Dendronephthya gigantea]